MDLSIKHPEVDRRARAFADLMGESLTDAVIAALRERLRREQAKSKEAEIVEELRALHQRLATYPVLDGREADDILGYDEDGLPS
jgi:antitoxin VapB